MAFRIFKNSKNGRVCHEFKDELNERFVMQINKKSFQPAAN